MVQVEIINIGDELLIGQVVNTNASQMAQKLNSYGFNVLATSVIGDNKNQIRESLDIALKRADCVLITGGLGPTKDDITKKILAEYFNSDLIINTEVEEHVKSYFTRKQLPFTETNRAQALVPEKCKVIFNPVGSKTHHSTRCHEVPKPFVCKHFNFVRDIGEYHEMPKCCHKIVYKFVYLIFGVLNCVHHKSSNFVIARAFNSSTILT